MRRNQILRLFQLEWQHRFFYHKTHLVGSVGVVSQQFLSNRINEVFQFAQKENLRESRIWGDSGQIRSVGSRELTARGFILV
jgi:hypothetical protein